MAMRAAGRAGYTWVELVVIVCVLFLLAALTRPAIQNTRTTGCGNVCCNNIRNLALAVTNYAGAHGAYPGYVCPIQTVGAGTAGNDARVSWVVKILPYLERTDIYQLYREPQRAAAAGVDARQIYLDLLVCPSAVPSGRRQTSPPPCNYVVNSGRQDVVARPTNQSVAGYPADWRANGVFFNVYHDDSENPAGTTLVSVSQDYIVEHDGSSQTVMLSERIDAGSYSILPSSALDAEAALGCVWWPSNSDQAPFEPPTDSLRINGPYDQVPIHRARPSSKHPGVVMVAFCDGHSRSIREDIDYGIWCLLQTPNGRACNTPGKPDIEPPGPGNDYGFLRSTEVDESRIR
jgi:prepilin-type processing-associated H-X9-DG protein